MRHVSPLRSVALPCNIQITYVTPKIVNSILELMLMYSSTHRHSYILVFKLQYVLILLLDGF